MNSKPKQPKPDDEGLPHPPTVPIHQPTPE